MTSERLDIDRIQLTPNQNRLNFDCENNTIEEKKEYGEPFKKIDDLSFNTIKEIVTESKMSNLEKIRKREGNELCRFFFNIHENPTTWEFFHKFDELDPIHNIYGETSLKNTKVIFIKYLSLLICRKLSETPELYKISKFEGLLKNAFLNENAVKKISDKLNQNVEFKNFLYFFSRADSFNIRKVEYQKTEKRCLFTGSKLEGVFYIVCIENNAKNFYFCNKNVILICQCFLLYENITNFLECEFENLISKKIGMNDYQKVMFDLFERASLMKALLFQSCEINPIKN